MIFILFYSDYKDSCIFFEVDLMSPSFVVSQGQINCKVLNLFFCCKTCKTYNRFFFHDSY